MLFFCVLSTIQNENQARQTRTEEDALLVRVGQGDREALETLYRLTSRAVYGCLLSIVKNPHDAEELMQDTYLQLVSSAGSYRPQGKPRGFILAVARNLGLMRLREERRGFRPPEKRRRRRCPRPETRRAGRRTVWYWSAPCGCWEMRNGRW